MQTGYPAMMNQSPEVPSHVQILRLPQVCRITGLGRSMIYQLEAESRFPARVRIGARAVGWVESEVQVWLAGRIQHHRACRVPAIRTTDFVRCQNTPRGSDS